MPVSGNHAESPRSLRQVFTSARAPRSTTSGVVARPSVSRMDPRASTAGIPIANNTPEAVSPPSWHADPVDAAISGVALRSAVPDTRGKRTLSVLGRRCSMCPLSATPGIAASELRPEPIAQCAHPAALVVEIALCDHTRRAEPDNGGDIFSARSQAPFVSGTQHQRFEHARRVARRVRRFLSARRAYGRQSTADRRRVNAHRSALCPPIVQRRCAPTRRPDVPSEQRPGWAEERRSRCSSA